MLCRDRGDVAALNHLGLPSIDSNGVMAFDHRTKLISSVFRPGQVWNDTNGVPINAHGGGVLFYQDMYYWYGEHKIAGPIGNTAQVGVHCYTSQNLVDWDDADIVLAVAEDDEGNQESEIAKGCILERPKVVYNESTQKFVMWFHLEWKGQDYRTARSAVAVAASPTGPFTFLESFRPHGCMARDMTLFVDNDTAAYHLSASEENATLHICKLSDDYLRPSAESTYTRVFIDRHMEAPAVCRRQGRYFFLGSDCTGWDPNPARSAIADSIMGPWFEKGNPCFGTTPDGKGPEITFGAQSSFLLPVVGKKSAFIAMFDQWCPENPIDGRYVWLPVTFQGSDMIIRWHDAWDLSIFVDDE